MAATEDDIADAGTYALGLMPADEVRAFEDRVDREPSLRAELALFQTHFAALLADTDPVTPPARVWHRLEAEIGPPRRRRRPAFGRLASGILSGTLAAGLAIAVLFGITREAPGPAFVARLDSDSGDVVFDTGVYPVEHVVRLDRVAGSAPEGRVYQLWLLPEGADSPYSLGLLPDGDNIELVVPQDVQAASPDLANALIEITIEPPGGSPTGGPTGEVAAIARLSATED